MMVHHSSVLKINGELKGPVKKVYCVPHARIAWDRDLIKLEASDAIFDSLQFL